MNCKICHSNTRPVHSELILNKYKSSYYKCENCAFIQTDPTHWLGEAYASAITHLDIGLLQRNLYLLENVPRIIHFLFPQSVRFIDYGGGYGVFVRLMRDAGFNFFRYDIYCENLFAKHFDYEDSGRSKFDVLTSFEVFEHLEDPLTEIKKMFELSDSIIFSTHLAPDSVDEFKNWWYLAPQTGQHIAFYHRKTFEYIAGLLNCNYYTNNTNLHVLTRNTYSKQQVDNAFELIKPSFLKKWFDKEASYQRPSLLQSDFEYIKNLNSIK
jgi:2-polyprenyl-3-methyl-5-hydroxy-6-metoxy-1,4-benzoquinol methylase